MASSKLEHKVQQSWDSETKRIDNQNSNSDQRHIELRFRSTPIKQIPGKIPSGPQKENNRSKDPKRPIEIWTILNRLYKLPFNGYHRHLNPLKNLRLSYLEILFIKFQRTESCTACGCLFLFRLDVFLSMIINLFFDLCFIIEGVREVVAGRIGRVDCCWSVGSMNPFSL